MTQAKHTPGPWHYSNGATILMGDEKWPLVMTQEFEVTCAVNPKYGAIISAAPDLLEALIAVLADAKRRRYSLAANITEFAYTTITKAKGETP